MLGLEGENEWNRTRHAVSLQEKASCRNKTISEPLPHKADPTERSWRGVLWCCRDTACRVRWFYVKAHPVGNVPPERFQNIGTVNGTQGWSGHVRSALEKLSLFSPTFPVRQKHGAGNFAVCGRRLRGHVPSKNTSPAALSWSSLFEATVLNSFCSCTMVFAVRAERFQRDFLLLKSADTARRVPTGHAAKLQKQAFRNFAGIRKNSPPLDFFGILCYT